jgi:hypothetical protein
LHRHNPLCHFADAILLMTVSLHFRSTMIWFGFMVFNATSNNVSAISWWSVLLVEEIGGPGENH